MRLPGALNARRAEMAEARAAVADLIAAARNVVAGDDLNAAVAELENVLGRIR